ELVVCRRCALVQIAHTVPAEQMFREYVYFSSFSDTMLRHAEALCARLVAERGLGPGSLVVEAASNDGYLLQFYRRAGLRVLGVAPAANVAFTAQVQRGVPTLNEFFSAALARRLRGAGALADVFHAHNVLGHVPELNDFVAGIGQVLKPDGVGVIEVPYV